LFLKFKTTKLYDGPTKLFLDLYPAKFSIPQQNHFRVQFVNKNCATEN